MIARLQAVAVGAAALLLIAFAGFGVLTQDWWWAIGPAVMGVAIHATVLAAELCLQYALSRHVGETPLRLVEIPALVLQEMVAGWRVFAWSQPFRSRKHADELKATGRAGVVLVHGFLCNRGVWNPWMRRLSELGIPFVAIDLEPAFGSVDDYAGLIDSAVERVRHATGRPPVLVGHSMGGIALRAWMAQRVDGRPIASLLTIASPHHGTWLSRTSRALNARQMAVGSEWLALLAQREAMQPAVRLTCFFSESDNVVLPWRNARLAGADNRQIRSRTHLALLCAPEILAEVIEQARPEGPTA